MKHLLALTLLVLAACSHKDDAPTAPAAEAPLKRLFAEVTDDKLLIYDEDGKILRENEPVGENPQLVTRRGFVAVLTGKEEPTALKLYNYRGEALLGGQTVTIEDARTKVGISDRIFAYLTKNEVVAVDTEGRRLNVGVNPPDAESEIYVSENIVAFTGKAREGAGRRLNAFTRQGLTLGTYGQPLNDRSQIWISDHLIGFTATLTEPDKFIKEENGIKTFSARSIGERLFTYTDDGRTLGTSGEILDDDSEITFKGRFVMVNVPRFRQGKVLKEEGANKTYELIPDGRQNKVFRFDGTSSSNAR